MPQLCIRKSAKSAKNLERGMWQSSHTARAMCSGLRIERNRASDQVLSNRVFGRGEIIASSAKYWIDGRRIWAAAQAPQRKRPCRSRTPSVDPNCSWFAALNPFCAGIGQA
jgi:hypothetical protein